MRLKKFRADRKMTQEALAEKAGISRTYLARLELGQQDPTLTTLKNLAKALKVTVGELVE
jgi:transcriptional regulator with XRE-family HTH domain